MQYELYINISHIIKVDDVIYDTETRQIIIGENAVIFSESGLNNFHELFMLLANNSSVYVKDVEKEKLLRYDDVEGIVCNNTQCEYNVLSKTNNKNTIIEIKVTDNNTTKSGIYFTLKGIQSFHTIYYNPGTINGLRNYCLYINDNNEMCQILAYPDMILKHVLLEKLPDFTRKNFTKRGWKGKIFILCPTTDYDKRLFCEKFPTTDISFIPDGIYTITSITGRMLYKGKRKYEIDEVYKADENGSIKARKVLIKVDGVVINMLDY